LGHEGLKNRDGAKRLVEKVAEVQVFGLRKSADTRKALRFFSDRRIKTHFVDLAERAASRGELTRFVAMFGVEALIDRSSARFHDLGLVHARLSGDQWLGRLVDEPLLLRMPLARSGRRLTIGVDEAAWREWAGR
jgi:arsenate reductase